ncbi:hypothetical protein FEZ18_11455 [Oceanihabitans sp. IOP_32]|uniref:hypothetical protein n=1 Tax=Oceanihabitans sp. IOP_32 TaxID=2529032 RepID=UPI001293BF49|nr:hypothetical protein [Oceanihabitans sp. IOP_32]QFZ55377.1 hypothetical protein FEZ18_11455 [Oceanihabitans sp. IOP_32]
MSKKIDLDKYYTTTEIAKKCIKKTYDIIGINNIKEIIEPSAGNGSFSNLINGFSNDSKACTAYDIEPEHQSIIQQDFLELDLPYKKGRLFIGNPPFGEKNLLAMKFFKHSVLMGDYISFILPISQYNNNQQMFEFDLIHSEDLGKSPYSGVDVHCCLNIYKRPTNGVNKKPNKHKLNDVTIKEVRKARNQFLPKDFEYDYSLCTWGDLGKKPNYQGEFNQEAYIRINNDKVRLEILNCLNNANWIEIYKMERSPRLKQWQILKHLKDSIIGIE